MRDINLIMDNIKEELKKAPPSRKKVVSSFLDFRSKNPSLTDSEFYEVIGSIFNLDTLFFLEFLYRELREHMQKSKRLEMEKYLIEKFDFIVKSFKLDPKLFMEKFYDLISESMDSIYGNEKSWEIVKGIIKKYCLYEGEQILYEFIGDIRQETSKFEVEIIDGRLLLTNYRFIVNGNLKTRGFARGTFLSANLFGALIDGVIVSVRRARQKANAITDLTNSSAHQRLPCFGYEFPIKNVYGLKKVMSYTINYMGKLDDINYLLKVSAIGRNSDIPTNTTHRDNIFEILSKEIT
jgi:hypothetical protein